MTDQKELLSLLSKFGVDFALDEKGKVITCYTGDNKIGGYLGFFTMFIFDSEGKFIEMLIKE